MEAQESGRIPGQSALDDLSRVHRSLADGSTRNLFEGDDAVVGPQQHDPEDLVADARKPRFQEWRRARWAIDNLCGLRFEERLLHQRVHRADRIPANAVGGSCFFKNMRCTAARL